MIEGAIDRKKEALLFKLKRARHDIGAVERNLKATTLDTIKDELIIEVIKDISMSLGGLLAQMPREMQT